jgi:hypothetical protein
MAEEQLRGLIDNIRARLQAELEQLGHLAQSHEQALHDARQRATADAEQQWGSKLEAVHAQWGSRLETEVASARSDVERALAAETMRARMEAEQAAADAAVHAKRQLDEAIAAERERTQSEIERFQAERERAEADLQRAQADLERVQTERERAQAERQSAQDALARAQAERERTQDDLTRAHADRERAQQELQKAHADREQAEEALRNAQGDHHRAQSDLQRAQSERQSAQDDFQRAQAELQRAQAERQAAQEDVQRAQAERERTQQDLQRAQEALAHAQQELHRAQSEAASIREQATRELAHAHQRHAIERASAADALADARQAAESMPRDTSGLLISLRAIDEARSLTEVLAAAVRGAALESPRAALFLVDGTTLQEWPVDGVPPVHAGPIRADGREAGFLSDVLRTGETVSLDGTNGQTAPMFAGLSPGRRAVAVPFVLDGRPVAVLYADEDTEGQPLASWLETVQILGGHATSVISSLTAVRTAQAMGFLSSRSGANGSPVPAADGASDADDVDDEEAESARRYAKLLISEIKLYNEGAVRVGRERRDLQSRLRDEIDRAHRLYDQRVSASLKKRDAYFRQELVQMLADGDQSLFD